MSTEAIALSVEIQAKIAELALRAADGAQDVGEALAALTEGMPDEARTEIVERFRAIGEEIQKERTPEPLELTPEMQTEMRRLKAYEEMVIAFLLSEKTREKIRRIMLATPGLFEKVVNIGEELARRGVFVNTAKQQITGSDLGTVTLQPTLANAKDKEKDAVKGR